MKANTKQLTYTTYPNGATCTTYPNGTKTWYLNGKRHRIDGPAVEHANDYKAWYLNDKLHRIDGPAIEWVNGDKEWWLNGEWLRTKQDWIKAMLKQKLTTKEEAFILAL